MKQQSYAALANIVNGVASDPISPQSKMPHPIQQANESSPFGNLTREKFYEKHNILHHETFMQNKQAMKIFTQSWRPDSTHRLRGLVAMVHGFAGESSWLSELTAVAIAKTGFFVCALDLQGHGYSQGTPGHIPNIKPIIRDCTQFFDSTRAAHSGLPAFLYGESLGGAIAILISLKQKKVWSGLILNGTMCGVSPNSRPFWALERLLPVAAFFAPTWRIVATEPPARKSYKEDWKRKLAAKSPSLRSNGKPSRQKPTMATAMELLRICETIRRRCHELEAPMLMLHGEDDKVCDCDSAKLVYELAGSKDKTLKIFPGLWHLWIGEPNESVEFVFGNIVSWVSERADKARKSVYVEV